MGPKKIVKIKWLDAWIEDSVDLEYLQANGPNKVVCTVVGTIIWDSKDLIAIASEKVKNYDNSISWRAVTFIPKSLILETTELGG